MVYGLHSRGPVIVPLHILSHLISYQTFKIGILLPILQIRRQRLREVK